MNYYEGYTKELNEILEALSNCNFDDLEDGYEFETQVMTPFKSYYNKNFDWASGATKGVLIFKDYGFVLKIPFSLLRTKMDRASPSTSSAMITKSF